MKYIKMIKRNQKSVQSVHPCKSVIQTAYDIVKAHGGDPDSYREKVDTKETEGKTSIIQLPITNA